MSQTDPGNPINWIATDPNPGPQTDGFTGDPRTDNDQDGLNALIEHAIGTSDQSYNNASPLSVNINNNKISLTHTKDISAIGVQLIIEASTNLEQWDNVHTLGEIEVKDSQVSENIISRIITLPDIDNNNPTRHYRLKVIK